MLKRRRHIGIEHLAPAPRDQAFHLSRHSTNMGLVGAVALNDHRKLIVVLRAAQPCERGEGEVAENLPRNHGGRQAQVVGETNDGQGTGVLPRKLNRE